MRFLAVIPNYNGAANLDALLRTVTKLGFDEVFVLDDASTDQSLEIIEHYSDRIKFVQGDDNLGPAGNRNRILPFMRQNDLLCFIDADMEVLSKNFRHQAQNLFKQETSIGIVGGLIFNKRGDPMTFNYGYFSNAWRDFAGSSIEHLAQVAPFLQQPLRMLARPFTFNLEIRYSSPSRQEPDWVSEAFCIMRGDVFREVGGFDESLRYHEGQRIARQFYASGYRVLYWPDIHARHLEIQTRPHQRTLISNWFKLRK